MEHTAAGHLVGRIEHLSAVADTLHATQQENWVLLGDVHRVRAIRATKRGEWGDAEQAVNAALDLCRRMPFPYGEAKALYVYGQLLTAKGESGRASQTYQAALSICERLGEGLYRPHIERALAGADARR